MPAYLRTVRSPLEAVTLDDSTRPASLAEAYASMAAEVARGRWAGWKLGGTNHGSRAAFQVNELYFGAIDAEEVRDRPARAPGYPLYELKGEVEVAVRIDASGEGFDAWCVALEMPSSPITNLVPSGVAALVADRCAAGALLIGPIQPRETIAATQSAHFTLEIAGETASTGTWDDLVAPPQRCFEDFLILARKLGFTPAPGQWVATGGITKCIAFAVGQRVRVLLDGEPVLDFVADEGLDHG